MEDINAQNEAQSLRRTEVGEISSSTDTAREERAGGDSLSYGDFSSRITGETGTRGSTDFSRLTGGILTQLIRDAEDQLGEARACIEWYERKEKEQLERLENLQKLQELEQHLLQEQSQKSE